MALETPTYELLEKDGKFEIRSYAAYITATVTLQDLSFEQASNQGFRLIADYIFGNNTRRDRVAMTAPVIQKEVARSEKIAMTAPVGLSKTAASSYQVSFVMPRQYTLETLPIPNNERIGLTVVPPATVAVMKFSGAVNDQRLLAMSTKLLAWTSQKGLKTQGDVSLARYSPPAVPAFMRKNEVAIGLET